MSGEKRPRDVTCDEADILAVELAEKENAETKNKKQQKISEQLAIFAELRKDFCKLSQAVIDEGNLIVQELEGTGRSSPRQ